MDLSRSFEQGYAAIVGFGVRVLLIDGKSGESPTSRKLAGLGSNIEHHDELYEGLQTVLDDPSGYGLVVINCDDFGGLAAGLRAHAMLKITERCIPVILISAEVHAQQFPESRHDPIALRAPLSAVSLRVGFEHALRERFLVQRAS